jgi:hypothetical protein
MSGIRDEHESLNAFGLCIAMLQRREADQSSLAGSLPGENADVMSPQYGGHQSFEYFRRLHKSEARTYVFQLDP